MRRALVPCALSALVLSGCGPQKGRLVQLLPSPTGAYQAAVLECGQGTGELLTVLKVLRAGEPTACGTGAVQEVALLALTPARIAWTSDTALIVEERRVHATPDVRGEVSIVFSPWKVVVSPPGPTSPP